SRTVRGRAATSVLAGFLIAGFVEDLTFLPSFDLIVLLLAAIAILDARAVTWTPVRIPRAAPALAALVVGALLVPVLVGDAASDASVRWSPVTHRELINAALVEEQFGEAPIADDLYRRSLLDNAYTAFVESWPRRTPIESPAVAPPTPVNQLALILGLAAEGQTA